MHETALALLMNKRRGRLDPALAGLIDHRTTSRASKVLRTCSTHQASPLRSAPTIASGARVQTLLVKDDSRRSGIGSFKAIGGSYAVMELVLTEAGHRLGQSLDPTDLGLAAVQDVAASLTVTCASAGNHGLSVALGARMTGVHAVVFLASDVPTSFADRLRALGAEVRDGGPTYSDAVGLARAAATKDADWHLVADGSWPGYESIPLTVMRGYGVTVLEAALAHEVDRGPATHVFVQAGVGGLAAAAASILRERWGEDLRVFVVEPAMSACLQASARADRLERVLEGRTTLGRLDCGEPSLVAWRLLSQSADAFVTVADADAEAAVSALRQDAISLSPCGAAGVAAAIVTAKDPTLRRELGLDAQSRVLCFGTEGPL